MLQVSTLPSGLRVATYKIDRQAAALVVTVGVGRRYELEKQKGLSHYVEHILFNGTKTYPSARLLRDSVEELGGNIGAGTSDEKTVYDATILLEHLDQGIKTLSEMIQDSLFDEKESEAEKETLRSEIHRLNDNPGRFIGRLITEALWPGQPLASRKDLEEKNFEHLTASQVKEHFRTYYTAPNMVVTIAGNVLHEEGLKKISTAFSRLPINPAPVFPPAIQNSGVSLRAGIKDLKQIKLDLAFYGPNRRDDDRFAVRILRSVLGKRIFYKMVSDLRLSYDPYSDYVTFEDTGFLEFGGSFVRGKVREALATIFTEIENLKKGDLQTSELEFARSRIKSSIILRNESVFALAGTYSSRVFNNVEPLLLEDEVEIVEKLSKKDIIQASQKYLNNNFKIAAIGPEEDIKDLEKLYGKSS